MLEWIGQNWFTGLQTVGIIAGLAYTALGYRADARERRIENVFTRTAAHREIWNLVLQHPHLKRVLQTDLPENLVPTIEERLWVRALVLHCAADFRARKLGLSLAESHLADDLRQFFSKPIPGMVWAELKGYQESDFGDFVEKCLAKS